MRNIVVTILFTFVVLIVKSQDIHYSQFYAAPLIYNPAFTGYFDGDYRATGNFKLQLEDFGQGFGNPYRTTMISADVGLLKPQLNGGILGLGTTFYNDVAGDGRYSTNMTALSVGYVQPLDKYSSQYLAVGFQGSYNFRSVDPTRLNFPDQVEDVPLDKYSYFNLSLGALWLFEPMKDIRMYMGFAAHNLIKPPQTFAIDNGDLEDELSELFIRFTAQFGSQFVVSEKINLIPSILFQRQGPHQEMMFGAFMKYKFNEYGSSLANGLQIGAWYRFGDAIVPVVRFDIDEWSIIFNYDVTLSKLATASRGNGGPEISLTYTGSWTPENLKSRKPVRCPVM